MKVDGKAIAENIYAQLAERRASCANAPRLGIIVAGVDQVIESFVSIKARTAQQLGVVMHRIDLDASVTTEQLINAILALALEVDALIVQLPLPEQVDVNAALSAIPDDKDVDAISTATGEHILEAPVALAVVEILRGAGIDPKGKKAVVVGGGRLVGAPSAQLLKKLGSDVSVVTLERGTLADLKVADIVVSGTGSPGLIKPEHLKKGVALIDAGASESAGKVVGDCAPECESVASVFTPVPGGVGPVAVAMLFKNLFDLLETQP